VWQAGAALVADLVDAVTNATAASDSDTNSLSGVGMFDGPVLDLHGFDRLAEVGRVSGDADGVAHGEGVAEVDSGDFDLGEVVVDATDFGVRHGLPSLRRGLDLWVQSSGSVRSLGGALVETVAGRVRAFAARAWAPCVKRRVCVYSST